MKTLCKIGLGIIRDRSGSHDYEHELLVIIDRRDELAAMMRQALHHLRDATACKSMKDPLEHWNLYLHRSYVTSELYNRPTLKRGTVDSELKAHLRETCIKSLADTVDALRCLSRPAEHHSIRESVVGGGPQIIKFGSFAWHSERTDQKPARPNTTGEDYRCDVRCDFDFGPL
jgi:hypothetical protein